MPAGERSYDLHLVQMDSRGIEADEIDQWFQTAGISYQDARILLETNTLAKRQTYLWKSDTIVSSEDDQIQPRRSRTLVGLANFFTMFEAPFLYGGAWSDEANDNAAPVAVISKRHNDYFFGGEDSVGRRLKLGASTVTVVGVLDDWKLKRRYYDMSFSTGRRDDVFVSDSLGKELNLIRAGRLGCPQAYAEQAADFVSNNLSGLLSSDCAWITFWADLDSKTSIEEYQESIRQHMIAQQSFGRFPREKLTYFLTNVADHIALVGQFRNRRAFLQMMSNLFLAISGFPKRQLARNRWRARRYATFIAYINRLESAQGYPGLRR